MFETRINMIKTLMGLKKPAKKRRVYRTKNRLFFQRMDLLEQLRVKVTAFEREMGFYPRKIYVSKGVMQEYTAGYFPSIRNINRYRLSRGGMWFKGIELVELKN